MSKFRDLVSIIIPCYNAQNYISRCVSSLERQTYKNLEIIIVDDCSKDNSLEIISNLKKQSNLKIVVVENHENLGPSLARSKGVSISTGDYICFCDSDDWFDDVFVEKMLSALVENNSDIVFCGYKVVNRNNKIEYRKLNFNSQPETKKECLVIDCDSLCMSLMKRHVIEDIDMPNIRNGEDAALIPVLIEKANGVFLIHDCLYNYYRRKDSASEQPNISIIDSFKKSFLYIKERFNDEYYFELEYLGIRNLIYPAEITLFSMSNNRKEGLKVLREFELSFPKWYKNRYIKKMPRYKRIILSLLRLRAFFIIRLVALMRLKRQT